ncbi:MAG: MFS transporter [Fibrobacterota bacterium]
MNSSPTTSMPDTAQPDEPGKVTDTGTLKKDRLRFSLATILGQSEEEGIGAVTTVIIRSLGGDALHLGFYGATGSINLFFSWTGTLLLKAFKSYRRAMKAAMMIGCLIAALIAAAIYLPGLYPSLKPFSLWTYLMLIVVFSGLAGTIVNIESAWIGDLVPRGRLGWFTSYKYIISVGGGLLVSLFFARMSDLHPCSSTYAGVYLIFFLSFLVATGLYHGITDRTPKNANFFSGGATHHERLNYKSVALWLMVLHITLWYTGRGMMFAFSAAYLLDQFHYSLTKVIVLNIGGPLMGIITLFFLGRISDRTGPRKPLLIINSIVAVSMFLWVSSAWFGVLPIILFYIISGVGGRVTAMLTTNYSLILYPAKGRSGYLAVGRMVPSIFTTIIVVATGGLLRLLKDWHYSFMGTTLNNYHLMFTVSAILTVAAVVPLFAIGNRTVKEA